MKLSNISIILVRPKNPGNVGSVVRAMMNMGLKDLVLVDPCDVTDVEARKMAVGRVSIIDGAKIAPSLEEALKPFKWTVSTTRRTRRRFDLSLSPREVAEKIHTFSARSKIAIIFGPEDRGLENSELALTHAVSIIPSHSEFPSLNLAQAVMIYAYEIYLKSLGRSEVIRASSEDVASVGELENMYEHFRKTLERIGYFKRGKPERLMESIRNFLSRAALSPRDVRIMRGILGAFEERLHRLRKIYV